MSTTNHDEESHLLPLVHSESPKTQHGQTSGFLSVSKLILITLGSIAMMAIFAFTAPASLMNFHTIANSDTNLASVDSVTPLGTAPSTMDTYKNHIGSVYSMTVVGKNSGSVWGSDIYTADSQVGKAAVNAGRVGIGQSKTVYVKILGPQSSYQGTNRNGASTSSYGYWGYSFKFVDVTEAPTQAPTEEPVSHPTQVPTFEPTGSPEAGPTHEPIAHPTLIPTKEPSVHPTFSPTDEPVADPTLAPTKAEAFTCKMKFTDAIKEYETSLQAGCVYMSATDLGWSKNLPAQGILACGTQSLSKQELTALGLINDDRSKSISYVFGHGGSTTFKFFTGDDLDGDSYTFVNGEESFISHKVGGRTANDITNSVSIVAEDYAGGASCSGAEDAAASADEHLHADADAP